MGSNRIAFALAAAMVAAWVAAGATGLIGYPLQRVLTWCGLAVFLFAAPGITALRGGRALGALGAALVAAALAAAAQPVVPVCGVALLVAGIGWLLEPQLQPAQRRVLAAGVRALALFAVYRLAVSSVPFLWHLSDTVAGGFGVVGLLGTGRALDVGATFGGLDFVVLSVLYIVLLGRPMRSGLLGIALVHVVYLVALSQAENLTALLGRAAPWNLPALAAVLHAVVAAWVTRRQLAGDARASEGPSTGPAASRSMAIAAAGLAVLLPVVVILPFGSASIEGKKVVVFDKCYGNWHRPKHGEYGRLSIGMYGMLELFIESHGGTYVQSKELSSADLQDADVVVLLFPHEDWQPGQLERLERYVQDGGSLLLLGEHTTQDTSDGAAEGETDVDPTRDADLDNRFNQVLASTSMRVAFDSATFEVGGWLQSYGVMAHPATVGVGDQHNEFGVVIGASVETGWAASPILLGKWGYNDPGDLGGNAMMGDGAYVAGERLGDVVLAAEQRIGKGTVVAFGDTSSLTNGITIGSHDFNARLLGYLANRQGSPQVWWRQLLGMVLLAGLGFVLVRGGVPSGVLGASVLASALLGTTHFGHGLGTLIPDGRRSTPNNLAYFDCSHLGRFDDEAWRLDGTMGMRMTLMRNGFLTLELKEFTWDRVHRAGLIVSVAPQRRYTSEECAVVKRFVAEGGVFVLCASHHDQEGSRELLDTLGFEIGRVDGHPGREPQPMGHFKAPFSKFRDAAGDYMPHVRFHEAWPVSCSVNGGQVLAYGRDDNNAAMMRILPPEEGKGAVVVVGDTGFLLNKNLEMEGGQAFEGLRENADFWRWLLTHVRRQPVWTPPRQVVKEGK